MSDPPKSGHPAVSVLHKKWWRGTVRDKIELSSSGNSKKLHTTTCFPLDQLEACVAAHAALQAKVDAKFWATVKSWAAADPKFEGVPLGPEDIADAEPKTVYWRPNQLDGHKPFLAVRVGHGKQDFVWKSACQHTGCTTVAAYAGPGTKRTFCLPHGGGCKHNRVWSVCRECNPNAKKSMACCSICVNLIAPKRRESKGGSGLCPGCDDRKDEKEAAEAAVCAEAEAAAKGEPPPPEAPAAKKRKLVKEQELMMYGRLVLSGYVETFDKGRTPRPGEFIREAYFDHRCALAREFQGDEKKFANVDFVVCPKKGGMLVFLEVDEGEHKFSSYTVLCDTTRMWNVCESIVLDGSGDKHVLWVRLNPDTRFAIGNDTHSPSNEVRCNAVCALLDTLEGTPHDPPMRIVYACYQLEADCTAKLTRDPEYHVDVLTAVHRLEHRFDAAGGLTLALA